MTAGGSRGTVFGRRQPLILLASVLVGLAAGAASGGTTRATLLEIARPVGALWLDALTMTVVPLVFGLLVTGVASASRSAAAGPVTARATIWFGVILLAACVMAAFAAQALLGLWPPPAGLAGLATAEPAAAAGEGATTWYAGIIPANPIKAAAEMAMVPVVVFALFLGFATARLDRESGDALLKPLDALTQAMLVIVGWVLKLGPVGIGALAFGAGASLGAQVFGTLGHYVVVVSAICLGATLLGYAWAWAAGRTRPDRFARAALPAQAVAVGTQSSLATLPVMVAGAARLGVRADAAGIVLPLAVSVFRAASAAANVAVAIYLAHLHGPTPGIVALLTAAVVAVPVSLGAVGLPAQVSFFATIAPVCLAIGVPVGLLPLLLAIEALPDLFRTLGNVTNDLAVAAIVGREGRESGEPTADARA